MMQHFKSDHRLQSCVAPQDHQFLSTICVSAGKKGPDLGEYDPLTQADSEDESEEDDLVLNYPRNGLGRDSRPGAGSSKLLGSRSGRHVGARGEAPDDEEEEDEWRERQPGKGKQYWGRDRAEDDGGGPGPLGGTGVAVHGTNAEEKRRRTKRALRSALFLVPLFCAVLTVLLSAFLIPCQNAKLQSRRQWEQALGAAGGKTTRQMHIPARLRWKLHVFNVSEWLRTLLCYTDGRTL